MKNKKIKKELNPSKEGDALKFKDIKIIKKSNGVKYSIRKDRRRYFFPSEWILFINSIKNKKHKFFFITSLHTGGRIMEVLNLKFKDIDEKRQSLTFNTIKQRTARKNYSSSGNKRSFFVASNFFKEYKSYVRGIKINPEEYIFLNNKKLPKNYENLLNKEKQKYYISRIVCYSQMLKNKLKRIGVKDYYNFSPHNIRKTYGMWMRIFNKEMSELCYRMGHDLDTFMNHYGSSLIFTEEERRKIQKIMGDVK